MVFVERIRPGTCACVVPHRSIDVARHSGVLRFRRFSEEIERNPLLPPPFPPHEHSTGDFRAILLFAKTGCGRTSGQSPSTITDTNTMGEGEGQSQWMRMVIRESLREQEDDARDEEDDVVRRRGDVGASIPFLSYCCVF